jgi:hypothetical protein
LKPVFKKLLLVHQKYIDREEGDYPYWYSERPHISLLAAAVWLSDGTALEEYGIHKTKERKPKRGRCDLGIRANKKTGFECEAKHLWLDIGSRTEDFARKVKVKLQVAVGDVKKLESKTGLALCFVTPAIHKSELGELDMRCDELIRSVRSNSWWNALIWIRIKKGQRPVGQDLLYLGLLLAIKEVKRPVAR